MLAAGEHEAVMVRAAPAAARSTLREFPWPAARKGGMRRAGGGPPAAAAPPDWALAIRRVNQEPYRIELRDARCGVCLGAVSRNDYLQDYDLIGPSGARAAGLEALAAWFQIAEWRGKSGADFWPRGRPAMGGGARFCAFAMRLPSG